jgi:hypothetical protein
MKVVYTEPAFEDLGEILSYLQRNYPAIIPAFEKCLETVVKRIADWPESAQAVQIVRGCAECRPFATLTNCSIG